MSDLPAGQAPVLDRAAQLLADRAAAGPDPRLLPVAEIRARLDRAQLGPVARPEAHVEDLTVPGGPTGPVRVRIVRPPVPAAGSLPVVLHLHGGGWVAGSATSHDRLLRELAVGAGAAVVFVDYDLAPEAPYPTALRQADAVARWITERGHTAGLDAARMAVVGDSAGGNLAAALTLMAKEHGAFSFVQQVLLYPPLSADCDTPSYRQFAHGYFQSADYLRWLWQQYVPDPTRRTEPTAAPLHARPHRLAGLPPALVITAEADVLRDEGEAYAAMLRAAGVPVTAVRYLGTVHAFVVLDALHDTPAARAATAQITAFLRDGFHPRQESS
ncbi:alpha/beta hydrolase [Kitasatospora kifunensis]|uniref:Acetyl esterase/lipase n=1 Tax=Kitasatospora kifunensis TaxID=58351 RepID=A0A7W7RAC1_KITKI|nr:alpha/beta hydrolase [Kitasatospora kifunensis]MBB4928375.1 acetyl esterase/lipase [Kitasatospora kifunensis]